MGGVSSPLPCHLTGEIGETRIVLDVLLAALAERPVPLTRHSYARKIWSSSDCSAGRRLLGPQNLREGAARRTSCPSPPEGEAMKRRATSSAVLALAAAACLAGCEETARKQVRVQPPAVAPTPAATIAPTSAWEPLPFP